MTDNLSAFLSVLAEAQIPHPTGALTADGKVHRYKTPGDKQPNSWYVLHETGDFMAGAYGCWKRQIDHQKWRCTGNGSVNKERLEEARRLWQKTKQLSDAERAQRQAEAAEKAERVFAEASADPRDLRAHPYLQAKQVLPHGLAQYGADAPELLIPLRDARGKLWSMQRIFPDGTKRFLTGSRVEGCFHMLSDRKDGPLIICEGYATAATCFEATGFCTIAAISCGNLAAVYADQRRLNPARLIILASDNDQWTDGNPGLSKCREIAKGSKEPNCVICLPIFSDLTTKPTDFNDLSYLDGLERVRDHFRAVMPVQVKPLDYFQAPPDIDPRELVKHGWLRREGFAMLTAPTGAGKSTLLMQLMALWSNGLIPFGMEPTRCMKFVLIQAENDDGDLAEMRDGVIRGLNLSPAQAARFLRNVVVYTSKGEQGHDFVNNVLRPILEAEKPDVVVVDPLLAYIGGDASSQSVCNTFLRSLIQPLLKLHSCACFFTHHISKPSKKDKADTSDPLYSSFGSSELNNIFRAQLVLEKTTEKGIYRLVATKREDRLRWRDEHGDPTNFKFIQRSKDFKTLCWFEVEPEDAPQPESHEPKGRPPVDRWSPLCSSWNNIPLTRSEILDRLTAQGIPNRSARRAFQEFLSQGRIISLQPHTDPLTYQKGSP